MIDGKLLNGVEQVEEMPEPWRWITGVKIALLVGTVSIALASCGAATQAKESKVSGLLTWPASELFRVSCPSAGECTAAGSNGREGEIFEQRGGRWMSPLFVKIRSKNVSAVLTLLSCSSDSNCVAGGAESTMSGDDAVGVLSDVRNWNEGEILSGRHQTVTQTASACSPFGPCWIIETDTYQASNGQFASASEAVGEVGGRWLPSHMLGAPLMRQGGAILTSTQVDGISCWATTACTVVGELLDPKKGDPQPFLQTEVRGRWGPATLIRTDSSGGRANPFIVLSSGSLSCTGNQTCLLGGVIERSDVGAVEQEVNGIWRAPVLDIGMGTGTVGSKVDEVSCYSSNFCVAAGETERSGGQAGVFVQMEINGRWLRPLDVKARGSWNAVSTRPEAASCPTTSACLVVGTIETSRTRNVSFIANYAGSMWNYKVIGLGSPRNATLLDGLSCSARNCWVVGSIATVGGVTLEGVAFPIPLTQ
jgi:hypothetical protein